MLSGGLQISEFCLMLVSARRGSVHKSSQLDWILPAERGWVSKNLPACLSVRTCQSPRAQPKGQWPRGKFLLNHASSAGRLLSLVTQREWWDITLPNKLGVQPYL